MKSKTSKTTTKTKRSTSRAKLEEIMTPNVVVSALATRCRAQHGR